MSPSRSDSTARFEFLGRIKRQGVSAAGGLAPSMVDQVVERIGGWETFISACRLSKSPAVKEFVRQWEGLSKAEQEKARLEDLCQRLGIDPRSVIDEVVSAVKEYENLVAQMENALALPGLME